MLDRSILEQFYQSHADSAFAERQAEAMPPDHYPLVTRSGTVPVAELATRGLYSQARYRAYQHFASYEPAEFGGAEWQPDAQFARLETEDPAVRIGEPGQTAESSEVEAGPAAEGMPALAAAPAEEETPGQAKLIDVAATLALR